MALSDRNIFNPGIYKTATFTPLPRPIENLSVSLGWDMRESKVPLDDGVDYDGLSKNAPRISASGKVAHNLSGKLVTEIGMYDAWTDLVTVLDVSNSDTFEFIIYNDGATSTYRKLKSCVCESAALELGDQDNALFAYSISIIAKDPVFYTSAPGS